MIRKVDLMRETNSLTHSGFPSDFQSHVTVLTTGVVYCSLVVLKCQAYFILILCIYIYIIIAVISRGPLTHLL